MRISPLLSVVFWFCASGARADDYASNWNMTFGCPVHGDTISSGEVALGTPSFNVTGDCDRMENGFAKFSFGTPAGGTLRASTRYGLFMRKLAVIPPVRTDDTTPLFATAAECPTNTQPMNWIFMQSDPSRVDDYFWGISTMAPTSTTMTKFYDINATERFSGNYSLPVESCGSGIIDVVGSGDFQAKLYSAVDWSGFYKTAPGNASFVTKPWTVQKSYFEGKTYTGLYYTSQDATRYMPIKATASSSGTLIFTVQALSNPADGTVDGGSSGFTDTVTINHYNTPLNGAMRGSVARAGHSTQNIGCLAHDAGAGGLIIACSARSPRSGESGTESYHIILNHKGSSGAWDPVWNTVGYTKTNFTSGWRSKINDAAIQPDGKVIAVGYNFDNNTQTNLAIARYNTDGTLDSSFGAGGRVNKQFDVYYDDGMGGGYWPSEYQEGQTVVINPDGSFLVGGAVKDIYSSEHAFIARFTSSGALDTGYGDSGLLLLSQSSITHITQMRLDGNGGLGVIGIWSYPRYWSVMRVSASTGSSDSGFNGGAFQKFLMGTDGIPRDLAFDSSGRMIVVGGASSGTWRQAIAVFTSSGAFDTTFDGDGKYIGSATDFGWSVGIQNDDKILVGGQGIRLSRYTTAGALDTTFSGDGMTSGTWGTALSVLDDGKIMVCGSGGNGFVTSRYNTDGTDDWTYGVGATGSLTSDIPAPGEDIDMGWYTVAFCAAMMVQTDGKIIFAGDVYSNTMDDQIFAIGRIIP